MYRTLKELNDIIINENCFIKEAIKIIDNAHFGIGIIVNKRKEIKGILTDPDIRRLILKSIDLNQPVKNVMNTNPVVVQDVKIKKENLKKIFSERGFFQIPIINSKKQLVDLVFKTDLYKEEQTSNYFIKEINCPVVIMAGGKGTRMLPFTNILPKPLIPINGKPIIEIIINEFRRFGITEYFISVNYKAKLIKAYFEDMQSDYSLSYIEEDKPLGTAGALKYLDDKIDSTFFVTNCDIIIKENYNTIFDFHKQKKCDLTIVASLQNYVIPYGVCEIDQKGFLSNINEKPEFNFLVNTGMYVLEPKVLKLIEKDTFYNITDLIQKLKDTGGSVGVFPVSEKAWIDVGQWDEYKNAINKLI